MNRVLVAIATALLLLPALPAGAFHSTDPLRYRDVAAGNPAWGIRLVTEEPTTVEVVLGPGGPRRASVVSIGYLRLDGAGTVVAEHLEADHYAQERLVASTPLGAPGTFARSEGGRASPGDTHDWPLCNPYCIAFTPTLPQGSHAWVVWVGGGSAGEVRVRASAGAVTVQRGTAHVLADPELRGGDLNLQAERHAGLAPFQGYGAGAKAMAGVVAPVEAAQGLWGYWLEDDGLTLCAVLACVEAAEATVPASDLCQEAAGTGCGKTLLSWDGPQGGGSGRLRYAFAAAPPGAYAFRVDAKADAYAPGNLWPLLGTLEAQETRALLSVADVAIPPG